MARGIWTLVDIILLAVGVEMVWEHQSEATLGTDTLYRSASDGETDPVFLLLTIGFSFVLALVGMLVRSRWRQRTVMETDDNNGVDEGSALLHEM